MRWHTEAAVKTRRHRRNGDLSDRELIDACVYLATARNVWEVHHTDAHEHLLLIFDSAICKRLMGNSNQRRGGGLALHFSLLGLG